MGIPYLVVAKKSEIQGSVISLPTSKSISNRALMLDALSGSRSSIHTLSSSSDTRRFRELLNAPQRYLNVMDAGTAMRFLTAYFTITGQSKVLTGTPRMQQRPIGPLVDALHALGGRIAYRGVLGFPPLEVVSFTDRHIHEVSLAGNLSSQYVSALMMVAPLLSKGLTICLEGVVKSRPYIDMTAAVMARFGVSCAFDGNRIEVPAMRYHPAQIVVEPDWTSVGYWMALTALARQAVLRLPGLSPHSIQGDRIIVDIMTKLGVDISFCPEGAVVTKKACTVKMLEWDFSPCPDLAQTVLPVCALKGIRGRFWGLELLRIKETDRIVALQTELAKVGARLSEEQTGVFMLYPASTICQLKKPVKISTYGDHRMAMGFAPWAAVMPLEVESPDVVAKSYPAFWDHLEALGFELQRPTI